ncbi:hypothetical protein Y032_0293g1601 [Ancylostoma ceylanicum]|nr:hypothetical protein Y032_0293g1601 [Ancylostoma ceylanicum]
MRHSQSRTFLHNSKLYNVQLRNAAIDSLSRRTRLIAECCGQPGENIPSIIASTQIVKAASRQGLPIKTTLADKSLISSPLQSALSNCSQFALEGKKKTHAKNGAGPPGLINGLGPATGNSMQLLQSVSRTTGVEF